MTKRGAADDDAEAGAEAGADALAPISGGGRALAQCREAADYSEGRSTEPLKWAINSGDLLSRQLRRQVGRPTLGDEPAHTIHRELLVISALGTTRGALSRFSLVLLLWMALLLSLPPLRSAALAAALRPRFSARLLAVASSSSAAAASAPIAARPPAARRGTLHLLIGEKDARLVEKDARLVEKNALLVEKDARLAEKDARLAEKDARLAAALAAAERNLRERLVSAERELRGALAGKDALLAIKDELLAEVRASSSRDVAIAKHAADVAKGVLNVRGLFEACLADIAAAACRGAASSSSPSSSPLPSAPSALLRLLLGRSSSSAASGAPPSICPGFVAYLRRAAADNGVPERDMLTQAGRLYDVLSERLHSDAASGAGTTRLPAEVFERSGRTTMVALAAVVRFSGRDIALYDATGDAQPLRLRLPPPAAAACAATFEALANEPFS